MNKGNKPRNKTKKNMHAGLDQNKKGYYYIMWNAFSYLFEITEVIDIQAGGNYTKSSLSDRLFKGVLTESGNGSTTK